MGGVSSGFGAPVGFSNGLIGEASCLGAGFGTLAGATFETGGACGIDTITMIKNPSILPENRGKNKVLGLDLLGECDYVIIIKCADTKYSD